MSNNFSCGKFDFTQVSAACAKLSNCFSKRQNHALKQQIHARNIHRKRRPRCRGRRFCRLKSIKPFLLKNRFRLSKPLRKLRVSLRASRPFEFEGEHRLEQRQFRTPSPTAADTLHHVTLTPQRSREMIL